MTRRSIRSCGPQFCRRSADLFPAAWRTFTPRTPSTRPPTATSPGATIPTTCRCISRPMPASIRCCRRSCSSPRARSTARPISFRTTRCGKPASTRNGWSRKAMSISSGAISTSRRPRWLPSPSCVTSVTELLTTRRAGAWGSLRPMCGGRSALARSSILPRSRLSHSPTSWTGSPPPCFSSIRMGERSMPTPPAARCSRKAR